VGVLVDTSILIDAERHRLDLDQLFATGLDEDEPVAIAAVTASELLHGVHRLRGVKQVRAEFFVETILQQVPVMPFTLATSRVHAMLSADLAARHIAVGPHDLLIAATAVALGYDVATRDLRSFPRIKDLQVRYW